MGTPLGRGKSVFVGGGGCGLGYGAGLFLGGGMGMRRGSFGEAALGVDAQYHAAADMVRLEAVPLFDVIGIDAEAVGDAEERVALADTVADQMPLRIDLGLRRRDDELFARIETGSAFEAVGLGDGRRSDFIFFRDGTQRLTAFDAVAAPAHPLIGGDVGDFGGELFGAAGGQVQLERGVVGGG